MLTQQRLKEVLRYEPDTGKFYWLKVSVANQVKVGDEAGYTGSSKAKKGYHKIRVDGKVYPAHRLAWLYVHGYYPQSQIDHLNTIRTDNRIENLRECSPSQNARNRSISTANTSGTKGLEVRRFFVKGKDYYYWSGKLTNNNNRQVTKYFPYTDDGKAQAIEWVQTERIKYHGEFARHE